jgi:hypothetical protein
MTEEERPQITSMAFTTRVTFDGWEGDLVIEAPTASELRKAVRALQKVPGLEAVQQPRPWQYTPEGLPLCPKHGVAMQKRERQGDVWHSHNMANPGEADCFCRGYKGKNSPGWDR